MAGARDIRAGGAFVEISARNGAFMRGLSQAQGTLRAFAGSCQSIGASLLAVSGAALAPLGMAASAFAGFDDAMRSVAAVTGATGDQFEALTARARELGASTRYTAQDAAGAMLALGRAGMSAQQIDAATQSVLALATATGTDLAQSADIMSNTLNMFGMGADRASDAADLLTATANGSAQTLTDLFESLRMVGPQAKAAGYDLAETSAALGVLANVGLKGSMAGTALKRALQQFADPGTRQKLADIGVAVTTTEGELRALPAIFRDLAVAMNGMPGAEKLALAKDIFDVRASGAGLNLAANVDALDAFLAKLRDVQGAAAKTETQMNAGIGGALAALKSAAQDVALSVGDALAPALKALADRLREGANCVSDFIKENKGLVVGFAKTVGVIAIASTGLWAFGKAISAVSATLRIVEFAFTALRGAIVFLYKLPEMTISLGKFAAAFKSVAAAANLANVSIAGVMTVATAGLGVIVALIAAYQKSSSVYAENAQAAVDAMAAYKETQKQQDESIARLKELSEKQRLSDNEMVEAARLLAELETAYGKFGVTLDTTTRKLNAQADSFDKVNEAKRRDAIITYQQNIRKAEQEIAKLKERYGGFRDQLAAGWSYVWSGFDSSAIDRAIDEPLEKLQKAESGLAVMKAELEALQAVGKQAAAGGASSSVGRAAETEAVRDARKELEKLDEEMRRNSLSVLEKEVEDIEKARDAYIDAARAILEFEKAQAKQFRNEERIAELEEKIAAARVRAEEQVAAAKAKAAAAGTTALAELESAAGDIEAARSRRAEDKRLDELSRVDGAGYMRELSRLLDAAKSGAADAAEKYRLAVSGAMEDGLMTDEERSAIADLLDAYRAAEAEVDRFADRIDRASTAAGRSAASVKLGAAGTFYAAAAAGMADRYEIRIADATEKAAKDVRDILDEIRRGAGEIRFA